MGGHGSAFTESVTVKISGHDSALMAYPADGCIVQAAESCSQGEICKDQTVKRNAQTGPVTVSTHRLTVFDSALARDYDPSQRRPGEFAILAGNAVSMSVLVAAPLAFGEPSVYPAAL